MKVKWKGFYCYSLTPIDERFGFEINVDFKKQKFNGFILEDELIGLTDKKVIVDGFVESDQIHISVKYPFLFDENDDGSILIDESKDGHEVLYIGTYNKKKDIWEGEWEVLIEQVKINNDEFELIFDRGYWQMQRVGNS